MECLHQVAEGIAQPEQDVFTHIIILFKCTWIVQVAIVATVHVLFYYFYFYCTYSQIIGTVSVY